MSRGLLLLGLLLAGILLGPALGERVLPSGLCPLTRPPFSLLLGALALGLTAGLGILARRERQDRERLRTLLADQDRGEEQVRLGTWSVDLPDWRIHWSRGMYRLLGLDPSTPPSEDLMARRLREEDLRATRSRLEVLAAQGGRFVLDMPLIPSEGAPRKVRAVCESVPPEGPATRLFGTLQDVTEIQALGEELEASRQRLHFALEGAQDGLWDWNVVTGETFFSPRYFTMLGYEPGAFPSTYEGWKAQLHPQDLEPTLAELQEHLENRAERFTVTFRMKAADGGWRWILARGKTALRDDQGRPLRMVGTHSDITRLKEAEERLRESEERWQLALRGTDEGVWDWDLRRRRAFYSDRFQAMLGFAPGEMGEEPRVCVSRVHPEDLPLVSRALSDYFNHRREDFRVEHRMIRKDGEALWVLTRGQGLFDSRGRPLRLAGSIQDISERRNHEETIAHQATHDALTGLPNRALFLDRLDQALARASRSGERLGVVFLDLDHFKDINDTRGHLTGDRVLVEVARRLKETLRAQDTVARMGGDEFTFLLPGILHPEQGRRAAERLRESFRDPFYLDGEPLEVTASLGVSLFPENGDSALELMRTADLALYRAKARGRNRYELAGPLTP